VTEIRIDHPTGVRFSNVDEIPDDSFLIRDVGGVEIGVTRAGGRYFAVRNICPHHSAPICRGMVYGTMLPSRPGTYEYGFEHLVVVCPWHTWEFNLETGRPMFTNGKGRLRTYPVAVHQDAVYVDPTGRPLSTTAGDTRDENEN
jgi:nitrite reductase/ring-hydroxylating ferredoxin subunit